MITATIPTQNHLIICSKLWLCNASVFYFGFIYKIDARHQFYVNTPNPCKKKTPVAETDDKFWSSSIIAASAASKGITDW